MFITPRAQDFFSEYLSVTLFSLFLYKWEFSILFLPPEGVSYASGSNNCEIAQTHTERIILSLKYSSIVELYVFASVIELIMDCGQRMVAELKIELKNRGAKFIGTVGNLYPPV